MICPRYVIVLSETPVIQVQREKNEFQVREEEFVTLCESPKSSQEVQPPLGTFSTLEKLRTAFVGCPAKILRLQNERRESLPLKAVKTMG